MLSLCQDLLPPCREVQERTGAVEDGRVTLLFQSSWHELLI